MAFMSEPTMMRDMFSAELSQTTLVILNISTSRLLLLTSRLTLNLKSGRTLLQNFTKKITGNVMLQKLKTLDEKNFSPYLVIFETQIK